MFLPLPLSPATESEFQGYLDASPGLQVSTRPVTDHHNRDCGDITVYSRVSDSQMVAHRIRHTDPDRPTEYMVALAQPAA